MSASFRNEGAITTVLRYLADDPLYQTEKPFQVISDLSGVPGARYTNHKYHEVEGVRVTDIRSLSWKPELDREGFQFVQLDDTLGQPNFATEAWVQETYYKWVAEFLKRVLQAKEVRVFEHQLRFRQPGFEDNSLTPGGPFAPPVQVVHADQTERAARARFYRHWPDFKDEMWSERWQIINLWRPLNDVVSEWPLAFCDYQSVDAKDIRGSDLIRENYNGESGLLFANPDHRWYYASEQKYNEGWLFKLYDSDPAVARMTFHSAIDTGPKADGRRSCEIRALVRR